MINVKMSKYEKSQGKLSKFDFEITCNANNVSAQIRIELYAALSFVRQSIH